MSSVRTPTARWSARRAHRVDVRLADADDVAGLVEADVGAEDLLGVLEDLEAEVAIAASEETP